MFDSKKIFNKASILNFLLKYYNYIQWNILEE